MSAGHTAQISNRNGNGMRSYALFTTNDFVHDILSRSAFKGFSQYPLPWDDNAAYDDTQLKNVRALLPYHNHVDPDVVVGALKHTDR